MEINTNYINRMIVFEWLSLAAIFVGCFFFLHNDIKNIQSEINSRMLAQEQRTDRLYEMFIDLIKEGRK